jgi:hypothetical protein
MRTALQRRPHRSRPPRTTWAACLRLDGSNLRQGSSAPAQAHSSCRCAEPMLDDPVPQPVCRAVLRKSRQLVLRSAPPTAYRASQRNGSGARFVSGCGREWLLCSAKPPAATGTRLRCPAMLRRSNRLAACRSRGGPPLWQRCRRQRDCALQPRRVFVAGEFPAMEQTRRKPAGRTPQPSAPWLDAVSRSGHRPQWRQRSEGARISSPKGSRYLMPSQRPPGPQPPAPGRRG